MRNRRLDVLRCIAVLLVIYAHGELPGRLTSAGRVGVDLFFVLSGFLISGLLFTEYQKRGAISFRRFFIRRSLKIYPAFYFLLLASFVYQVLFHQLAPLSRYLSALFYMQNYGSLIWGHEWSLAVEEHFYILLPLFLLILISRSSQRVNPFSAMPMAFLVVAITCLALRIATVMVVSTADLQRWAGYHWAYATTHCRLDALFFGVLLGYLQHFRPGILDGLFNRRIWVLSLVVLSAGLLSSCLLLPATGRIMITAGITALYLSFGIVLTLCLHVHGALPKAIGTPCAWIGRGCAYVGMHSYSIYLWHLPVRAWGFAFIRKFLHIQLGVPSGFVFYVVFSIAFGIFMSRILEYPVLRFRDRIFPAIPQALVPLGERNIRPAAAPST
jgi:peptidoglycan/LPS O-acetylase OafA/YrhL